MSRPFALGKGLLPPTREHNAVWCGTAWVEEDNGVCGAEFQEGHAAMCFGHILHFRLSLSIATFDLKIGLGPAWAVSS